MIFVCENIYYYFYLIANIARITNAWAPLHLTFAYLSGCTLDKDDCLKLPSCIQIKCFCKKARMYLLLALLDLWPECIE